MAIDSNKKIYRFDADGVAKNPDEFSDTYSIKVNGKEYSIYVLIKAAYTGDGWVSGGLLESRGASITRLTGAAISCNSRKKTKDSKKKAQIAVIQQMMLHAKNENYPRKIIVVLGNLLDQVAQLKMF